MAAVKDRVVPAQPVPTVHVPQTVHKPQIGLTLLVLHHEVGPDGAAGFHDEVLLEGVRLVRVDDVVREELVAVEVAQLREVLEVAFGVEVEALGEVKLEARHHVVRRLQAVDDVALVPVGQTDVVLQILGASQETVEEVDDVAVGVGRDDVLGVHPRGRFQAQALARLVLQPDARLRAEFGQGAVVLHPHAGLHDPIAPVHGVVEVPAEFRVVLALLHRDLQRVVGLEIRPQAHHLQAVLHLVLAHDVLEVQPEVEARHLAVARRRADFVEVDAVVAHGEVPVEQGGAPWRHHGEGAAAADVVPTVVGEVHAGAVVQHARVVVEVEPKEAQLGAVAPSEGQFPVGVREPKWQASVVDVGVEQLGGLFEVAVLDAQQVADAACAVLRHALQRAVDEQLGTEGARPHLAFCLAHVAVACADVHHRADASSVLGREGARVDVGVGQGVRVEDAEQPDAVEGVVDQHAVEQDLVLDGGPTSDVELTTLVTCGDESRQHLEGLDEVRRATKTGDALDVRRADGFDRRADLGGLFFAVGAHFCAFKRHNLGGKQEVFGDHLVVAHLHRLAQCFVLQARDNQGVGACRHTAQAVVPVHVGAHPEGGALKRHRRKHHGLSRGFRFQESLHGALRPCGGGTHEKRGQEEPAWGGRFQCLHGGQK